MTHTLLFILVIVIGLIYANMHGNKAKREIFELNKSKEKEEKIPTVIAKAKSRKRKTLPKDFEELLKKGDIAELISIFDRCELDARGGYGKLTALAFDECPHELAKWLVTQGANLHAADTWGRTPLHNRSGSRLGNIESLLELNADMNLSDGKIGSSLHSAVFSHQVENTKILITYGANIDEIGATGLTPLELSLSTCSNIELVKMVELSNILLNAGSKRTEKMKQFVVRIGEQFEFHRAGFNKESVNEFSTALEELYQIFEVVPVAKRVMHDGTSLIQISSKTWQEQHQELWDLLVPSSGPAETVQGEVIRISGKISDELERNGGANWSRDHNKMTKAFCNYVQNGKKLSDSELEEIKLLIKDIKRYNEDTEIMCEFGVKWVIENPMPIKLSTVDYNR